MSEQDRYRSMRIDEIIRKVQDRYTPSEMDTLINQPSMYQPHETWSIENKEFIMNDGKPKDSPVGRVDVEATDEVTICAKCEHCVPDMSHVGEQQLAYAKCAASAEKTPDRVNVVTGKKISKVPDMEYCSVLNHGECPNYSPRKIKRGRTLTSPTKLEKLKKMLDDPEYILDENAQLPWEKAITNPWKTTWERIRTFFKGFKFE